MRGLAKELPPGGLVNSVDNFGKLEGNFWVSDDGAAQYSLPLWMPRGRGTVAPALKLSYSSRGGEGPFGVGWSMVGLSSITWCPRTIALDGYTDGLHTDGTGALCLGDNRLLPISASYSPTREYRTQRATFAHIIAYGTNENVPDFFRVWTKDGRILTFGETADSRLQVYPLRASPDPKNPSVLRASDRRETLAWGLNRVEDRNGNSAKVTYRQADGPEEELWWTNMLPASVAYSPNRHVDFHYEPRPDPIDRFTHGGLHTRINVRASSIQMWAGPEGGNPELLREYRLDYENYSVTRRSLLHRVHECDHNGACKQPLQFDYSKGWNSFQAVVPIDGHPKGKGWATINIADVNGDGRSDLIHRRDPGQQNELLDPSFTGVRRSVGNGFAPLQVSKPYTTAHENDTGNYSLRIQDVNADGRSEIAAYVLTNPERPWDSAWAWQLFRSSGAIYAPDAGGHAFLGRKSPQGQAALILRSYFADLNGDGLPDYVEANVGSDGGPWWYSLNTGIPNHEFTVLQNSHIPRTAASKDSIVMDTDGDGRAEMLTRSDTGAGWNTWGLSATGMMETGPVNLAGGDRLPSFGDVNGDGLEDQVIITDEADHTHGLTAIVNTGNGFSQHPSVPLPDLANDDNGKVLRSRMRVVDFQNDGRDDVLFFYGGRPNGPDDQTHGVQLYRWSDKGFIREPLDIPLDDMPFCDNPGADTKRCNWSGTQTLDYNADGLLDLVNFTPESTKAQLFIRGGTVPDQLTGIGNGVPPTRIWIEYTNLADSSVHTPDGGTPCKYPRICPASGGSIVKSHNVVNGLGAAADPFNQWNRYEHRYKSARMDLRGPGWLGFAEHSVTNVSTSEVTVTRINNKDWAFIPNAEHNRALVYPFLGMPETVTTKGVDNAIPLLGRHYRLTTAYTNVLRRYADGSFFVEQRNTAQREEERPYLGLQWQKLRLATTTNTYDIFGNKELVEASTEGGRRFAEHIYYKNPWLGLPRRSVVTGCTPAGDCTTRQTTFDYDDKGNPSVMVVEPNDPKLELTTTIGYGQFGVIQSVTRADREGQVRADTYEYENADQLYPTAIVNAMGHRTLIETHSGLGVPLRSTDPNGVPTTLRYDWFGRPREANYADGYFEHVEHGQMLLAGWEYVTTTAAGGASTTVVFDQLGREIQGWVKSFDGRRATTFTGYDKFGQIDRVSRPVLQTLPGSPEIQFTRLAYDLRGRVTSMTAPDGAKTRHEYRGRETHTYDAKNVHSYTTETVDGEVDFRYEDDPNSTDWLRVHFEYGPFGEPTKMVAADGTEQIMQYDPLGRRVRLQDPASSGTTATTYNAFGEVETVTAAENRTTTFEYDPLGRVKKETSPDGVAINTWDSALHGKGKLATARSADGVTVDYTYTEFGKNAATAWTIEGTRYEFRYAYDNIGRLACLSYPLVPGAAERLSVGYFYNPQGYLAQATDGCEVGSLPYWTAEARSGADQLERERYGNGVITTRTYRPDTGLLDRIQAAGPGTIGQLTDITYGYDANRNVKKRNDQVNQRVDIYHYDVLNRLDGWSVQSDAGPPSKSTTYAYDGVGNLKTETVQSANQPETSTIYRYGEQGAPFHALTSLNNQKYGYDHAGQQTSGPNRTVEYNTFGLPTVLNWGIGQGQARQTTFTYDPYGGRVSKRDKEQSIVTVSGLFERRTPAGTGLKQIHNLHNIIAEGRVIAQVNRVQDAAGGPIITSRVAYLHIDLQGSTVALTDHSGGLSNEDSWLREQFYEPFGRRINAQNEPVGGDSKRGGPRQGYTGHYHDIEYGLIDMTGRLYDPEARRFLTPDPIVQNPLIGQSHNRYTYVGNNPTTLIDPTGWQACDSESGSCQDSGAGGGGWIFGTIGDLLTEAVTGGFGGGTSGENYQYGPNVITTDGVDDDVSWSEETGQLAEVPGTHLGSASTFAIGQGFQAAWPSSSSPVVFWSGYPVAMTRAAKVAAARGGSTIADTWEGGLLDWLYSRPALQNSAAGPAITNAANKLGSAAFAFGAGAAGRPKQSVIKIPESPTSVRSTVELPAYRVGRVARVGAGAVNLLTSLPAIDQMRDAFRGIGQQIDIEGLDPGDYCVGCYVSVLVGPGDPIKLYLVVDRNILFIKKFYIAPDPCLRSPGC